VEETFLLHPLRQWVSGLSCPGSGYHDDCDSAQLFVKCPFAQSIGVAWGLVVCCVVLGVILCVKNVVKAQASDPYNKSNLLLHIHSK
jgi:hypothetical protein